MKPLFLILIFIIVLTGSCEKDNIEGRRFEGTWVVKKLLADPGNGSGRYQSVQGSPYLVFLKDGSAKSDYSAFGLHLISSFNVTDSVQVQLSFKDISSQPSTTYRYKFTGDTLILNPPCFEGCGLKLVRAD